MKKLLLISVVFMCIYPGIKAWSQKAKYPTFKSITNEDGLSQSNVTSICQDQRGIMWFGTHDGLNRYDGNSFKIFRNNPDDVNSICSNNISTLLHADGYIWIGTLDNGLSRFDPRTESFFHIDFFDTDNRRINNLNIACLLRDDKGVIWAGTERNGLLYFDPGNDLKKIYPVKIPVTIPEHVFIRDIEQDGEVIWIATDRNGLIKFLPGQGIVNHYFDQRIKSRFDYDSLRCVVKGPGDYLWLGTSESYLHKFNTLTGKSVIIEGNPELTLRFRAISALLPQGDSLWIATSNGGLYLYHTKSGESKLYSSAEMPGGVSYNSIRSLYLDDKKILWVGTKGKGINLHHPGTKKFTVFSNNDSRDYNIDFTSVRAILEVDDQVLVGGYHGFNRINLKTGESKHFLPKEAVYVFRKDAHNDNLVWIGTEGGSIFKFDLLTNEIQPIPLRWPIKSSEDMMVRFIFEIVHYRDDIYLVGASAGMGVFHAGQEKLIEFYRHDPENKKSIGRGEIKSVLVTDTKEVWVGSNFGGLSKFNYEQGSFERFENDESSGSITSNKVISILDKPGGDLWVGTHQGLNIFCRDKQKFSSLTTEHGLPNNIVYGILGGNDKDLFLSTNYGLSHLDLTDTSFSNFTVKDGLPSVEFNTAAYHKGESGRYYFGGVSGLVSFLPGELEVNLPQPRPSFSELYVNNDIIKMDTMLQYKSLVTIEPGSDFLTFELSAQNYLFSEESYFQYKIPELSNKWINLGRNNTLSFINHDHGKYNILIRASMDQVNWHNAEKTLTVILLPWFYDTIWFKVLVTFFGLAVLFGLFMLRVRVLKRQENRLIKLVKERTSDLENANLHLNGEIMVRKKTENDLREANNTKDKFFSILAHDLRNPFSALLGFSEILSDQWDEFEDVEKLEMVKAIKSNSENTYNLLVNLLDWSRLQGGKLNPVPERINVYEVAEGVLAELKGNFELKLQQIKNAIPNETIVVADHFMLGTIIRNLLSNAIKYTPMGGRISIQSRNCEQSVICTIEDNGIGIEETSRKKLFDIENANSLSGTDGEIGTGLGLVITYEFTRLINGKLWVESKLGEGSKFNVLLPKA